MSSEIRSGTSGDPRPERGFSAAGGNSEHGPAGPRWSRGLRAIGFILRAIEIRLRFVAVLVAIGLLIGYWETIKNYWQKWTRPPASHQAALEADQEFFCPMHPSVVRQSLEPDGSVPKCPICGMPLSKRRKGAGGPISQGTIRRVQLSPYQIQAAGVRTVPVEIRPLRYRVRTVGYITYDESRRAQIVSRVSGYVEKLYVNQTYQAVDAGQPLAEVYSPELYAAVQELRIARASQNTLLADAARQKLLLLGLDEREIDAALQSGAAFRLVLRAPRTGVVITKRIVEGASITAGETLFELADLTVVWIEADVYERDLAVVHEGQQVRVVVDAYPDRSFTGQVALVYPQMQERTRTNRVRFSLANPNQLLRPGMFATVELEIRLVELEPFRSRLHPESIATDDDAAWISRQKICPVTGLRLGSMGKPVRVDVDHQTVFVCCNACRSTVESDPQSALARLTTVTESGVLAVPEDAVIDTGQQKLVYVQREPGVFEAVEVTLGPRADGYYAVLDGLLPGDQVAAAGAFLIDAETRLHAAAGATYFGASGHQH